MGLYLSATGARLTRAQFLALAAPVVADPEYKIAANTEVLEDAPDSPGDADKKLESGRRVKFSGGETLKTTAIDKLFPVATFGSCTPATGPAAGGTAVTIKGTNLDGSTGVQINGVSATAFAVPDKETITCTTPAGLAGARNIVILDDAANVTVTSGYTYI